jgi:hypothetical protein
MAGLSDEQRAILDFERQWWRYAGGKSAEIEQHLSMSTTEYYAALNEVLDHPDALEHDPTLVRRLQRARALRRRRRASGSFRLAHQPG